MRPRLPAMIGGAALVAVGVVLLLRNLDLLPTTLSVWPMMLLAVGVVLLVTGLQQGHDAPLPEAAGIALDGAREVRMVLKYGAGTLDVVGDGAAGSAFQGTFAGGVVQETRRDGDHLGVTLRHPGDIDRLARQTRGLSWSLALTREVPVDLEVQSGASRLRLDLTSTLVRMLRLQVGASDVDVRLPAGCRVHVSAGAADVRLHVPEGAAASISAKSALASVSVDQARFPRAGEGYRSPGYESATERVEILLEGGVASFRVD